MRFSVLQFFSWPGRRVPLETVYRRALERVQIMDQGGYDAVWLAEHHFSTYSVCPSVHIMGMHVAGLTKNIRIGTGVSLAAFYHPLRLAEEVALLDNLSGGRVNWGAGRGFDRKEMEVFGVGAEGSYDRFRENVEIVLAAWGSDRLTYEGRHHSFQDVEVLPKPLQDPMPVWIASTSVNAIDWAASHGHSILMDPHATHAEIGTKYRHYLDAMEKHGFTDAASRDIPVARLLAIAPTDEAAEKVAREGAQWTVGSYASPKTGGAGAAKLSPEATREAHIERYVQDVIIHGSPARVVDQLQQLEEEMPLGYLIASILSHETFLLLTDEVIPRMS